MSQKEKETIGKSMSNLILYLVGRINDLLTIQERKKQKYINLKVIPSHCFPQLQINSQNYLVLHLIWRLLIFNLIRLSHLQFPDCCSLHYSCQLNPRAIQIQY